MGKKAEKALRGNSQSSTSKADDSSITPEPYIPTGSFSEDFAELWVRAGLDKDYVPVIKPRCKPPATPILEDTKQEEEHAEEEEKPLTYTTTDKYTFFRPNIQVEYDVEDTKQGPINHAQQIFIRSWKFEDKVLDVFKECKLDKLTSINFWNAGLNDYTLGCLADLCCKLSELKSVTIEGNAIETEPFCKFLEKDTLQNLSLRNNAISDKGAKLIAECVGTTAKQLKNLEILNLSFNHIGDEGAEAIAKAMRTNRSLVSISLASNRVGDRGVKSISEILQKFALTHEEVVKRRYLLSEKGSSVRESSGQGGRRIDSVRPGSNRSGSLVDKSKGKGSSKKKSDGKKDAPEKTPKKDDRGKKASVTNETPKGKGRKSGVAKDNQKKLTPDIDFERFDIIEPSLLDPRAKHEQGKVFMPGCLSLINLNLSRNRISEYGLKFLLHAMQYQVQLTREGNLSSSSPGLLNLSIQKNLVPHDNGTYVEINETMFSRNPLNQVNASEDDNQSVAN